MKKSIAIILVVVIIGLVGIAVIPGIIDRNQSSNAAKGVLDNVIEQDYEKAFESVYFFDKASDLEPTISFNEAKNKWINRVKDLKEQGTYVVDYSKLRVRLDDTYPVGTVDLIIMENGKKIEKKGVRLWFAKGKGDWKLGNFDYYNGDIDEAWEEVLSGHFKYVDLYENKISQEQEQNLLLIKQIDKLNNKIKLIQQENLLTSIEREKWYEEFDQKYPLFRIDTWDKIIISKPWNDHEVIITDKNTLAAFRNHMFVHKDAEPFGSGPFSDVPRYQYTFIKDDEKLTIDVLSRDIIGIDYDYFSTSSDIHLLGNAFFTAPSYLSGEIPIITKLALSGYMEVVEDFSYGMFLPFKIISIADTLAEEGELLSTVPLETSELSLTLHFYYFGEKIIFQVYKENYIQVSNGEEEYWFFMDDTSIFGNILSAG